MARLLIAVMAAALVGAASPAVPAQARGAVKVAAREVATSVERQRIVALPIVASHVALHWRGHEDARISVAFSSDGIHYGLPLTVEHDEAGGHAGNGRTYGGVLWTDSARFVRLTVDRRIGQLSVLAMDARRPAAGVFGLGSSAMGAVEQPAVVARSGWGANESLRFAANGSESWPAEFHPVQKLIVHHTAGRNSDPDPEATVRAIYHYHAITRGWGDIGYNFLIDESGRIYEGRYSRPYGTGETPTGEDRAGNSVAGAHVANHNAGTVGVALLGTLSTQDATPAARAALEWLLAWKAERHGVDPLAGGTYINPVNGVTRSVANIAGHRDYAATECPGGTFHSTLPSLRQAVAARMGGVPPKTVPGAPVLRARTATLPGVRLDWTAPPDGGSPITSYRISRLNNGKFVRIATVDGSQRQYRDGTARRGRTYTYQIRAVNALGRGPASNRASAVAR